MPKAQKYKTVTQYYSFKIKVKLSHRVENSQAQAKGILSKLLESAIRDGVFENFTLI